MVLLQDSQYITLVHFIHISCYLFIHVIYSRVSGQRSHAIQTKTHLISKLWGQGPIS